MVAKPCPVCGDRRGKFYVNVAGGEHNGSFNSYCCHDSGNLVKLAKLVEGFGTDDEAIQFIYAQVEGEDELIPVLPSQPMPAGVELAGGAPALVPTLATLVMALPEPLYTATPATPYAGGGATCLGDRGVDQYIIDRHQLRVTTFPTFYHDPHNPDREPRRKDLDNRLIVPSFTPDGSALLSWQARDMTGTANRKYVFPAGDRSTEGLYGFHEYLARGGDTLIVVEGVFHKWAWDQLGRHLGIPAIEFGTVASYGKKLTKPQEELIMATPKIKRLVLAWDFDAAVAVTKVAGRVSGRKELAVMLPHASGRDHDELTLTERAALLAENVAPYSMALAARMVAAVTAAGK